ncbi:Uma2 family endonuclease [Prosthecomicrobium sp. N25]|uniref:Uma2 family endonuclease n=1 Tax=Prosthecomicrobium sp. N25 TaxID=3129254 RepID=UPI0030770B10
MAETKFERMDPETFLAWATRQEGTYELVDGIPRAMTGARKGHDRAVVLGLSSLSRRLEGSPCEPFTEALAISIPNGNVRRPDITVDCGRPDDDLLYADRPILVIEVLSPSTRSVDTLRKVLEYQRVATIQYILLIEPAEPVGILHARQDGGWTMQEFLGYDTVIGMPAIGLDIPLRDFYRTRA